MKHRNVGRFFIGRHLSRRLVFAFALSSALGLLRFGFPASEPAASPSSFRPHENPQEEVTVTAVEVPVRVYSRGELVRDLAKDDFEVYENGVRQDVTHFEIISRKISAPTPSEPSLPDRQARASKRLFLLIFNIFDYNDPVGEAVDEFFRNIFRPGDQVVVLTEGRILSLERGQGTEGLALSVKEALRKFKAISTGATIKNFRELNFEAERLLAQLRGLEAGRMSIATAMIRFFENFQRIWDEYRRQFLEFDVDFYRTLIRRLKTVEGEKWAVAFQQREMFPKIRSASRLDNEIRAWVDSQVDPQQQVDARMVQARQQELQRSFDVPSTLEPDELSNLFLAADFTFHIILLKSSRTMFSQDFELREVGQDYEELLTRISRATGGLADFSNLPAAALRQATETEDFHYLLVYSPRETAGGKKRAIEVKVRRPGLKVVSLKNYLAAAPPQIGVRDVRVVSKVVSFSLAHYQMTRERDKLRGIVDVKITIFDEGSNAVFNEGKTLDVFKHETRISLNFGWLGQGNYLIIIQALDRLANQSDVYSGLIKL